MDTSAFVLAGALACALWLLPAAAAADPGARQPQAASTPTRPPGLELSANNPDTGGNDRNLFLAGFTCGSDNTRSFTGYPNVYCLEARENVWNGLAQYGVGTNAKTTFSPIFASLYAPGSGQRIGFGDFVTCYGMSDCGAQSNYVTYAGGNIDGDEGQNLTMVQAVKQQAFLVRPTIVAVAPRSRCDTYVTATVRGGPTPQTAPVKDAGGCKPGDWVILNTQAASPRTNYAAMRIRAVGAGTLTGVFATNMTPGQTITPATVLTLSSNFAIGQDRVLVDERQAPYSAGRVAKIVGYGFLGAGTGWSSGMVGGGPLHPGCVSLRSDSDPDPPFSAQHPLNDFYEIIDVRSPTSLEIMATTVAGDRSYKGHGVGSDGAYAVYPCSRIVMVGAADNTQLGPSQVVLDTNSFDWRAGDQLEEPITPYEDSTGESIAMGAYTSGGLVRAGYMVDNSGFRTMKCGFCAQGYGVIGSPSAYPHADAFVYAVGMGVVGAQTGFASTVYGAAAPQYGARLAGNTIDGVFVGAGPGNTGYGIDIGANFSGGVSIGPTLSGHALAINDGHRHVDFLALPASPTGSFTWTPPSASGVLALTSQIPAAPLAAVTSPLGGAPLGAGTCASVATAVAGATTDMAVVASPAKGQSPGDAFVWKSYVSAPGMVTTKVCAIAAGTPIAVAYNLRVLK